MKIETVLVDIGKLRSHEAISRQRLKEVFCRIKNDGFLRSPVVADRKTLIVLDGHHRLAALKSLGCQKIPVVLVDYLDPAIKVYLRRKNLLMSLLKEIIIRRALMGNSFPYKTTRHLLSKRPRIKTPLIRLRF